MTTERTTLQHVLRLSRGAIRLFRNNTARAWVGEIVSRTATTLTLRLPRPLHAGLCVGSSDTIGWRTLTITPDMVGARVAVFLAVETKSDRGRATVEQQRFVDAVTAAGGIGVVVRSAPDALAAIEGWTPPR